MGKSIWDHCKPHLPKLDSGAVWIEETAVVVTEPSGPGAGSITFNVPSRCLVVKPSKNEPAKWLREKKCADGAFILFNEKSVQLHILEMKSGLKLKDWFHVRSQFKGMLHNIIAIGGLIQIHDFADVVCYIAYKRDLLVAANPTALVLSKFQIGTNKAVGDISDWLSDTVTIEPGLTVRLVKIQRDQSGNGSYVLP